MATLCVKANEGLFDAWRMLGLKVGDLASIVQNDMELSTEEFEEWILLAYGLHGQIGNLIALTERCVQLKE